MKYMYNWIWELLMDWNKKAALQMHLVTQKW